jgi:hypothetical protein
MSRKAKHKHPTSAQAESVNAFMRELQDCAAGRLSVSDRVLAETIEPLLQIAEFGHGEELLRESCSESLTPHEMAHATTGPVTHYPCFKPSIDKAKQTGDRPELARWALALLLIRQFETQMPAYAAKLGGEMVRGRRSAATKDTKNALDLLEAWERDNGVALSSTSDPTQIAACAASIHREQSTVLKALQKRQRGRTEGTSRPFPT